MVDTNGIIWRFAGGGGGGYSGDGGLATNASMDNPIGIAVDDSGNVYIADSYNDVIRKVNRGDTISTFAGNHHIGFSGDGGPATAAKLGEPTDVAIDENGNLFIADYDNQRIRMVNTNGIISTVAGDSVRGYSGDGGLAINAELDYPYGVVANSGNFYIVDQYADRIRMVNSSGVISTIAGDGIEGYFGDGGPATAAKLHYPTQMAIDAHNNIYFADQYNNVIRKINDTNIVTSTNKLIVKGEEVRVFPNPNDGVFNLYLSNINNRCNVEIFNYLGEKIYAQSLSQVQDITTLNLNNQPSGIYLFRVITKNGDMVSEGKFVIQK